MARQKSIEKPRTWLTDSMGRLKDDHNELYERHWRKRFREAGADSELLHASGSELPPTSPRFLDQPVRGIVTSCIALMGMYLTGQDASGARNELTRANTQAVMDLCDLMTALFPDNESARRLTAEMAWRCLMDRWVMYYEPRGLSLPGNLADLQPEFDQPGLDAW